VGSSPISVANKEASSPISVASQKPVVRFGGDRKKGGTSCAAHIRIVDCSGRTQSAAFTYSLKWPVTARRIRTTSTSINTSTVPTSSLRKRSDGYKYYTRKQFTLGLSRPMLWKNCPVSSSRRHMTARLK